MKRCAQRVSNSVQISGSFWSNNLRKTYKKETILCQQFTYSPSKKIKWYAIKTNCCVLILRFKKKLISVALWEGVVWCGMCGGCGWVGGGGGVGVQKSICLQQPIRTAWFLSSCTKLLRLILMINPHWWCKFAEAMSWVCRWWWCW